MKMSINVRPLVKELLENKYLIVNYNELNDGGFDLSVRINEEELNSLEEEKTNSTCPYCGSTNAHYMYGTAYMYGTTSKNGSKFSCHYICKDCLKEFDV